MNKLKVWLSSTMIGVFCLLMGAFGTAAAEEDSPMAAGVMWGESSHVEKTAYLVGSGNFLTVEYIVQQKSENAPTDEQSAIRQWWDGLEEVSLEELIDAADTFYRENPDQMQEPVLVVIWNSFVETD